MLLWLLVLVYLGISKSQKQLICAAGEFSSSNQCQKCPGGKYMELVQHSQSSCKQCRAGHIQPSIGQVSCVPCQPGTIQGSEYTECVPCQLGTFLTEEGGSFCKDCPLGYFGEESICSNERFTSESDCIYENSGQQWSNSQCSLTIYNCSNGTYGQPDCTNLTTTTIIQDTVQTELDCIYVQIKSRKWQGSICYANDTSITASNRNDCLYQSSTNTWTSDRTQCHSCPAGHYQNNIQSSHCKLCPSGFKQQSYGQSQCSECNPGRFSTIGSDNCRNCPINWYQSESGSGNCVACQHEQYTKSEVSTTCEDCASVGNCCSGWGNTTNGCQPCQAGTYRNASTNKCTECPNGKISRRIYSLSGYDTCEDCQGFSNGASCVRNESDCSSGTFANSGHCQKCLSGTYRTGHDSITCKTCPNGWISHGNLQTCQPCSAGQTSNDNRTACQACPAGKRSRIGDSCGICTEFSRIDTNSSNRCDTCGDGQYWNVSTCTNCPSGWIKSDTVIGSQGQCVQCATNPQIPLINNAERTRCIECEAGKQHDGLDSCTNCIPGQYKGNDSATCRSCDIGQFQDKHGQTQCTKCDIGQAQVKVNSTSCQNCSIGTYSDRLGLGICVRCPLGWGNQVEGLSTCTDMGGHPCTIGCDKCAAGEQMSEENPYKCLDCVPGKFRNSTEYRSKCKFCPIGWMQSEGGKKECLKCKSPKAYSVVSDDIDEGFIACEELGRMRCNPGEGTNTQDGVCTNCTTGRYSIGGIGATCQTCPNGYISIGFACKQCDSGQENVGTVCQNCTAGRASRFGICEACPIGQISSNDGSTHCTHCAGFQTTTAMGSTSCTTCADRFDIVQNGQCAYCPSGQLSSNKKACTACKEGEELVHVGTTKECVQCKAGKYSSTQRNHCQHCPVGYTSGIGQTECSQCSESCSGMCPKGHFTIGLKCQECPAGYVSLGSRQTFCSQCTVGREQPEAGKSACLNCAPGKYSSNSVNIYCELCPKGQFQHMIKQGQCNDCRQGKYTDSLGQVHCKTCVLGKYLATIGADNNSCSNCPQGWQGISNGQCAKCPESTYQDESGQTSCKPCDASMTNPISPPGAVNVSQCFEGSGLITYVFDVESDGKESTPYTSQCEIRPNMVLVCPSCSCNDNVRDGYWDGPVCDECRHGFAGGRVGKCLIKCPGYDGIHDSTMCSGNGKCWFGKYGSGECLCGGKNIIDASSNNIVVNVKTCPAGHRCSGYGTDETETKFIPFYYILEYRQYSVFVLQLNLYTPMRGHMWFERYSPQTIYENTCATCTGPYDGTEYTQIGYFSEQSTDYTLFNPEIQIKNGFHGENCQHECALCLNSGHCLNTPHPFYYSYSIESKHETFTEVFLPQTQCICSSDIFDADAMCCPQGFEPYVYFGKRQVDPYFHHTALPFITNVKNTQKAYWTNEDLWLKNIYPKYEAPMSNTITVSNLNLDYNEEGTGHEEVQYLTYGPYTKHIFYGTEKEICRACPGLFGKGVVSRSTEINSEQLAEDFWWDSAAKGKKCNGLGVCDFYLQRLEKDVLFMGEFNQLDDTQYKLEKRFTGCSEIGNSIRIENGIEECIRATTETTGSMMLSEAYRISGYIGKHSIISTPVPNAPKKPIDTIPTQPWGYLEKDGQFYLTNQTVGLTSIPVPDANGKYLFHPWEEGNCVHFTTCTRTTNKLYSLYRIGITGQGDDRLQTATFDRFDTCFTYDDGTFKTKIGNYVTETYENGQDPFLGKNCPKGHFCTKTGDEADKSVGFKEACPPGYYQPMEAQTRTDTKTMCSKLESATIGCQPNTATNIRTDFVDKVCIRCNRNEYSKEGSAKCTACPQGRVKKISSTTIPIGNLTMLNMPSAPTPTPWYYIPEETGEETSDCALVPSGIIHVPEADVYMNYDTSSFLPVVSCPYGYSSRPGTYVIDGHSQFLPKLQASSQDGNSFIVAPFIQNDGFSENNGLSLALDYCFQCPTNSMTSAGSMLCATCFGNQLKIYLKDAVVKLVESNQLIDVNTWKMNGKAVKPTVYHLNEPIQLEPIEYTEIVSPNTQYILTNPDLTESTIDLGLAILACNAHVPGWSYVGFYKEPGNVPKVTCISKETTIIIKRSGHCSDIGLVSVESSECSIVIEQEYNPVDFSGIQAYTSYPSGCHYDVTTNKGQFNVQTGCDVQPNLPFCNPTACSESKVCFCMVDNTNSNTNDGFLYWKLVDLAVTIPSSNLMTNGPSWNTAFPFCAACPPGKQTSDVTAGCDDCIPGKFTATMQDSMDNSCKKCPEGWYQVQKGMSKCLKCEYGQYQPDEMATDCDSCPEGWSQDQLTQKECKGCEQGYHMPSTGETICKMCQTGKYMDQPKSTAENCISCPEGWSQSTTAKPSCLICERGKYQNEIAQPTCTHCPTGWYQPGERQHRCISCERGKYQNKMAKDDCTHCPTGWFQDKRHALDCKRCQNGWSCTTTSSSLCEAGKYAKKSVNSEICTDCPEGWFQDSSRNKECKQCTGNTISKLNKGSTTCIPCKGWSWKDSFTNGYYDNWNAGPYGFLQNIKHENYKYCTASGACKDKNRMLCFAEWTATFTGNGQLCFGQNVLTVVDVVAMYAKPVDFSLEKYLSAGFDEDKVCNHGLYEGWLDGYGQYNTAFRFLAHHSKPYAGLGAIYDWGIGDRIFAQRDSTYYTEDGIWSNSGNNLCSKSSYSAGKQVKIIMVYYGGHKGHNRIGIASDDTKYKIDLHDDERCYNRL